MHSRERVFAMLEGRPMDCLPAMPITMMFAAGQIGAKYLHYATDCRVQVEGRIRVGERFGVDHISVISEPCCEVADLGGGIKFFPDHPSAVDEANALLAEKTRLAGLRVPDPSRPGRMLNSVRGLKERVGNEKLLEGWIEGPCGETADLRGINRLMLDFYDDPAFVRDLMDFVGEMELRFARARIEAGVDLMGMGNPAASLVSALRNGTPESVTEALAVCPRQAGSRCVAGCEAPRDTPPANLRAMVEYAHSHSPA
jgi:uroporphyrinogen-III decarboxylase